MDPKNIERYSRWARPVLEAGVRARMLLLGIAPEGDASRVEAGAASAGGAVLSAEEARMRDALLAELDAKGEDELVRRAAYTWFNRLLALRYVELKGLLPHGRHVLSDASGTGLPPEAASEPEALGLPALPREAALRLKAAGDAQATFRAVLVAQAGALARALPKAFGPEGDPLALLLPDGLLGPEGAVRRLVEDLPADDLERPEALGWAYQYWAAEEKDSVFAAFKKGRKAGERELPVATQLFTPDWIVDYLVQNSLGRLWMLNASDSPLAEEMPYYVAPEGETEPTLEVSSPEEIAFCDPACGSGHMLLAAFRLLGAMYEEVGYRRRDVPALVFANNLSGMEIDARAAQLAELCLALEACSWDRNFLAHPTSVDVTVLQSVSIDPSELPRGCALSRDKDLLDALSHLSLAGSLLEPSAKDVSDVKGALASLPAGLGDANLRSRLEESLASCQALSRHFSVVVTNPPYMGSKNMAQWLKAFVAKHYPDAKRDLCTCFIERCLGMLRKNGYEGIVTTSTCLFISSYADFRRKLLEGTTITSMIDTSGSNNHPDVFDANAGWIIERGHRDVNGGYFKLSHPIGQKKEALLEALRNPSCGWFYRRCVDDFKDIPGMPIAYWASDAVRRAFREGESIAVVSDFTGSQNKTGNNAKYLRNWWEISNNEFGRDKKWITCYKGGQFRRWYGNLDVCVDVSPEAIRFYADNPTSNCLPARYWYRKGITYTDLTSGRQHFRYAEAIGLFDMSGPEICENENSLFFYLGALNCSTLQYFSSMLNPTMHIKVNDIKRLPMIVQHREQVTYLVNDCIQLSKSDWDSIETSWDFSASPLIGREFGI